MFHIPVTFMTARHDWNMLFCALVTATNYLENKDDHQKLGRMENKSGNSARVDVYFLLFLFQIDGLPSVIMYERKGFFRFQLLSDGIFCSGVKKNSTILLRHLRCFTDFVS